MYLKKSTWIQLFALPVLYFFIVLAFWKNMGSLVFLFGIIPIIINTFTYSHVFLNTFSILFFSLVAVYLSDQYIDFMFYEITFWGVFGILFVVAILVDFIRYHLIVRVSKKHPLIQKMSSKGSIRVTYDVQTELIVDISKDACKFYGWKKNNIINESLLNIHVNNFLTVAPFDFWENLLNGETWSGIQNVRNSKNVIYEENAIYYPLFDDQGTMNFIEKVVTDVFIKNDFDVSFIPYQYLFYHFPNAIALIDNRGIIENHNNCFAQEFSIDGYEKKQFIDMCPPEIHHKIHQGIQQSLMGEQNDFVAKIKDSSSRFIFIPYFCSQNKGYTKTFFILQKVSVESQHVIEKEEIVMLSTLLKDCFTTFHNNYPNTKTRLFSASLPSVYSIKQDWETIFMDIFYIANQYDAKVTVTNSSSYYKHFFNIQFESSHSNVLEMVQSDSVDPIVQEFYTSIERLNIQMKIILNENPSITLMFYE